MNTANTWKRLWARIIDQAILGLIILSLLFLFPAGDGWMLIPYPAALGLILIPIFYESSFYYLFGATPGKWIFHLKVVPVDGLDYKHWGLRVLLRATATYFTLFFGWAVYATALFRVDRRHLCDWLAETRVVSREERIRPKARPILASILIVFGVIAGLSQARTRFGVTSFERSGVKIPDPFDFTKMLPSADDDDD